MNRTAKKTELINCHICQSYKYKKILTKFEMNLVKCMECGLVYANPILQESELFKRYTDSFFFDEYLPAFKALPTYYDLGAIRSHFFIFLQLIAKFFTPGKRLLDVGCGAGFFLKAAEETGWEAEGVELSSVASKYAKNIVKVKVHEGKLEDLHLPADKFDLVALIDTIEHLRNPLLTLKEINRILTKEGILLIGTPDFDSLSRLLLRESWAVLSPEEHFAIFSHNTLSYIIQKANFRVLGIRNLLQFNPEYTHDKKRLSYYVFKSLNKKLESLKKMEKTQLYEYADIMLIEEKNPKNIQNFNSDLNPARRTKRTIHKWSKKWLRGDTLVAVAKKTNGKKT
ncbi:MAG: class I SAM-dependent methyltransferase [Candidatus Aminicenantes bacterium]|nr:class I SAM-dependent methyltransferase [Candidatus Aminicenantes bacterium]MBL7082693.1 class I SAM-dependent methyltransferase [Candidatus Aminicenantes bacterium]